jgi:hydroxymethylpyrimidine/phosphomethylpyrimidine kinase
MPLGDAIQRAHDFVQRAIRSAPSFGAGSGPIDHLQSH